MDRNQQSGDDQSQQFTQWLKGAPPEQVAKATSALMTKIATYQGGIRERDVFAAELGNNRDVETGIAKLREFSKAPAHT